MSQVASMIPVRPHTLLVPSVPHRDAVFSRACLRWAVRPLLTIVVLFAALAVHAQPPAQESLTDDFPGLSAKERSRIAKKEVEEAAADTAFQAVMKASEVLFQQRRYEEALEGYRKARAARPYNVYPKVKIHDLEAMLSKRAEEAAASPAVVPTPVPLAAPDPVPPAPAPSAPSPGPAVQQEPRPAPAPAAPAPVVERPKAPVPAERPTAAPVHAPASVPEPRATPVVEAPPMQDGMVERTYKEGNAHVIERSLTVEGHTTVFKRVIHPWGGTYHFRDGKAIDERVWKEQFGGN